jgi:hypothetical protein
MRDDAGRRNYTLVHASKSLNGFVAMKEAVSTGLRSNAMPVATCDMIRDDLRVALGLSIQTLEKNFAGTEVAWRAPKGSASVSVRRFMLENTPMFDFQLEDLKTALVESGLIETGKTGKPKKPIKVRFPSDEEPS